MEPDEKTLKAIEGLVEVMQKEDEFNKSDSPKKQLEKLISEKKFGKGLADRRLHVRWGGMFARNQCPVCGKNIEKTGGEITCKEYGLRIPLVLYENASKQYREESAVREKEVRILEEMEKSGLSKKDVEEAYGMALERYENAKKQEEGKGG